MRATGKYRLPCGMRPQAEWGNARLARHQPLTTDRCTDDCDGGRNRTEMRADDRDIDGPGTDPNADGIKLVLRDLASTPCDGVDWLGCPPGTRMSGMPGAPRKCRFSSGIRPRAHSMIPRPARVPSPALDRRIDLIDRARLYCTDHRKSDVCHGPPYLPFDNENPLAEVVEEALAWNAQHLDPSGAFPGG